jgi:hypothetical protein
VPACCGLFAKQVTLLTFFALCLCWHLKFVHNGNFRHFETFVFLYILNTSRTRPRVAVAQSG